MFVFIGDHFLTLVIGAFAVFGVTLGGASIRDALPPRESGHR
ncbi:hypothetical protein [Sphingomonas oryzagri]